MRRGGREDAPAAGEPSRALPGVLNSTPFSPVLASVRLARARFMAMAPAGASCVVALVLGLLAPERAAAQQGTAAPAAPTAEAQKAEAALPGARRRTYSQYEEETIARALRKVGGRIDTEPQGKAIEDVVVVSFDVIEDRDPAPQFLNWFHVTTKDDIVRREVLLNVGQPFVQSLSDETERNLRVLFLFSVVIALPLQGSTPDRVRYLVITKDIWSLRAGWDGRFANGVIDYLSVRPTETNLFGTSRQVYATLAFDPHNYTVGFGFVEPRLAGTRLRIAASAQVSIECQTGELGGYSGSFSYSRPLFSTRTKWSYSTSVSVSEGTARLVGTGGSAICSAPEAEETRVLLRGDSDRFAIVPGEYQFDSQAFTQSFTRSFGWLYKTNLSFGLEASRTGRRQADLSNVRLGSTGSGPSSLTEAEWRAARNWYTSRVRPNEVQVNPFFQIQSYTTNFHRDINAESLGLQEDFRLGPIASVRIYPATTRVLSTRDLLGINAVASYAGEWGSGYWKVEATHDIELSSPEETDAVLSLRARLTTPRMGFGRFVFDSSFSRAYYNYNRTFYSLDNTSRLRGYRARPEISNDLFGTGFISHNTEFRTRPVQLFSTLLGAVVFHDIGDAFYELGEIKLKQGAGVGIRFLAPQLDRDVLRIDLGFPLPPRTPEGEMTLNVTFGQAFAVP